MQKYPFVRLGALLFRLATLPPNIIRNARSSEHPAGLLAATALMAACWLGFLLPARATEPIPPGQQVLKGHVPKITKRLTSAGRLDGSVRLDLAIGLPLRNREQLTNLLHDIYEPSSANFRHYLTADEFTASFGPTPEDYQAVADFAKSHGLTVKRTHPNRTLLDVSGSVADIEKAFHIRMHVYQHPSEARTFFALDVEPSLDLAVPVLAISGLDNYKKPRPNVHLKQKTQAAGSGGSVTPLVRPLIGGGGGGGGGGGSGLAGYMGSDFPTAYAAPDSLDGTGQAIALFELTGYDINDIMQYESEALLPSNVPEDILIDGFDGSDTQYQYSIEATGDIEMAVAMAPGSTILVYEGPTPLDQSPLAVNFFQDPATTAQINDVFNRMATDNRAKQISSSYIMDVNTSTMQIFQQFAAQGQSFFQASGDFGGYPGAIDEPADNPYLTVVGGTTLSTSSTDGTWTGEVVWLTPASTDLFGDPTPEAASGGGVSLVYPIPVWQQGISMTLNQGSTTMRNLPDVAMVANNIDEVWGDDYFLQDDYGAEGTSLAAPLWAGIMALVNQRGAATGQSPVGFLNPVLYAIGKNTTNYHACFHDIISGNSFSTNSPTRYSATPGYDLCTGWGTPIVTNLIQALLAPPTESLVITPPAGFTASGPGGGPFSVVSQTYTLKNIGASTVNWSLSNTSHWLSVSKTSGALSAGASTTVAVSLNTNANGFMIANFSGNVVFANLTGGSFQNRQFDLYVGNGGFEAGGFSYWNVVGDPTQVFAVAMDDVDVAGTNALNAETPDVLFVHSGFYGAYLGSTPSNGSLSQAVPTTAGQRYVVSFWLTSFSNQEQAPPITPNYFSASWNGSTLYAQTNLDAFGWTNLQYVVPATATTTTLGFVFENDPAAFGLDDVTVETVPAPVLQSVKMTGGTVTLTWTSISNLSYQLQSAGNLINPSWSNISGTITASSNLVSATEPISPAPRQFYRVVLLPPP